MKLDVKKLLILNLPYVVVWYVIDKIAWLYRMVDATEIGMKLYGVMLHFSHAFSNILPSFHPVALLIGFTGAALFRAVVYFKGKNKKKYRQGMEYGSARWGTAEDIKPYIDPVPENNIILTATEKLTMNSRPKAPKYARNKNVLVIGGSGSGKTRFFVKPSAPVRAV